MSKFNYHFLTDLHSYGGRSFEAQGKDKAGKTVTVHGQSTNYTNDPQSAEFHLLQDRNHFAERVMTNPEYRKSIADIERLKKAQSVCFFMNGKKSPK